MYKRFDVHGWDYNNPQPQLARMARGRAKGSVQSLWEISSKYWGGKFFSLMVCDNLATGTSFAVPKFQPFTKDERIEVDDLARDWNPTDMLMIRSSYFGEDWQDPRAGIGESKFAGQSEIAAAVANSAQPCIIQKAVHGVGLVVDIGFSELLQCPLARVAVGHEIWAQGRGIIGYTSPTWDNEASVTVHTVDESTPRLLYGYQSTLVPTQRIVAELLKGLNDLSIEFGVQCEIIVDPKHEDCWHLVQVRPSPAAIRGMQGKPQLKGQLIYTTGKVNMAGAAEGHAHPIDQTLEHPKWSDYGLDQDIIVWQPNTLWHCKYHSLEQLHLANQHGVVGQVALGIDSLILNSTHGSYLPLNNPDMLESVRTSTLLIPIDDDAMIDSLEGNLWMVSDGLIAQIYQL